MYYCCNLTRTSPAAAIPLIRISSSSSSSSRFSRCFTSPSTTFSSAPLKIPETLDSSSLRHVLRPVTISSSSSSSPRFLHHRTLRSRVSVSPPTTFWLVPRTLEHKIGVSQSNNKSNRFYIGARVFSTGTARTSRENGGAWSTAYKEGPGNRGQGVKRRKKKSSQARTYHLSSWDDSAERYFSRRDSPKATADEGRYTSLVENARDFDYGREDRGEESVMVEERNVDESEKRSIDYRREHFSPSGSWESYSSRNGSKLSKENRESRDGSVKNREYRRNSSHSEEESRAEEQGVEVGEIDAEPRIRSKYRGFIDRDSQFNKPEVRCWNRQEDWGKKTWKEVTESSVPKIVGQGVYGVGPVLAALTVERREFYALYVQEGLDLSGNNRKKDKKGVEKVLKLAEKMGLKVTEASKHDLNMVVDNRPHQGLVLDASPLEMVNIKELELPVSEEGHKTPLWVALDEVTDPQNLGAIVRSSYFFGAEGVVLCAKNSAPLTGVVSKASAGSLELIELRSCKNMMQFLSSSIENGWRVLGGSVSSRALPLSVIEPGVPTILVLGSEGSGLRPLVGRACTQLVRIPGNMSISECPGATELEPEEVEQSPTGPELNSFLAVESLNVSVAAGVLLYHLIGSNTHLAYTKLDIAYQ